MTSIGTLLKSPSRCGLIFCQNSQLYHFSRTLHGSNRLTYPIEELLSNVAFRTAVAQDLRGGGCCCYVDNFDDVDWRISVEDR